MGEGLQLKGKKKEIKNFFSKLEYPPSKISFPKAKPCHRFGEGIVGTGQSGGDPEKWDPT